jgi:integrase
VASQIPLQRQRNLLTFRDYPLVSLAEAPAKRAEAKRTLAAGLDYDGDRRTTLALRLLSLTFVRTVELRFAEWSEFDLERAEWGIPVPRMKMRQPHIVPPSTQAVAVIQAIRDTTTNKRWSLPSPRNLEQPVSENTILHALHRMASTAA